MPSMTKVYYDVDEAWPDYTLYTPREVAREKKIGGVEGPIELPTGVVRRFRAAKKVYDAAAGELCKALDAAGAK